MTLRVVLGGGATFDDVIHPIAINSMGAMVAFLTEAGRLAEAIPAGEDSYLCHSGTYYDGITRGCIAGDAPSDPGEYSCDPGDPPVDLGTGGAGSGGTGSGGSAGALLPNGAKCTDGSQCLSGWCDGQCGRPTAY